MRKVIATIIDYGIYFTLTFLYMMEFGELNADGEYHTEGIASIPSILLWILWFPGAEALYSSTFGHWIVGLKVVDDSGADSPDIIQLLKRRVADIVDIFIWGIPAFIAINKTDKSQPLGDLWGETMVIRRGDD